VGIRSVDRLPASPGLVEELRAGRKVEMRHDSGLDTKEGRKDEEEEPSSEWAVTWRADKMWLLRRKRCLNRTS
jgi:hypothetical protein